MHVYARLNIIQSNFNARARGELFWSYWLVYNVDLKKNLKENKTKKSKQK